MDIFSKIIGNILHLIGIYVLTNTSVSETLEMTREGFYLNFKLEMFGTQMLYFV